MDIFGNQKTFEKFFKVVSGVMLMAGTVLFIIIEEQLEVELPLTLLMWLLLWTAFTVPYYIVIIKKPINGKIGK